MDFAFNDEQQMLRESAVSFLGDRFGPERVAELAESEQGWDPKTWTEIAGLGWLGLSVPEESGGAGMGFLEEAVLFEELGRALYPGPFFSSIGLALPALASHAGALARLTSGESAATIAWAEPSGSSSLTDTDLGTKAESSNGSWTITGEKHLVPDLGAASDIVVVAASSTGTGLWLVAKDAAGMTASTPSTMDATRRLGHLALEGADAELLVGPDETPALLERIRLRALAGLALEAVGVAQAALDMALVHAKERVQFDKPIGTYQAVAHPIADTYMDTELARSLAYWAAWCVAEQDEQAPMAVAAAKAWAGEAAVMACERSIQVHGGIGFTYEHMLHRYYKRAQWIDSFEGYGTAQRADIAQAIFN